MKLHELAPPPGARRRRKIVGRGPGSGHGQTAGRGDKGQKARSGKGIAPWFEGGQLPLHRRVPKRGFTNPFRVTYAAVNLKDLARFAAGTHVTPAALREAGLIRRGEVRVKILAEGQLANPVTVAAHKFSKAAAEKIRARGGTVEVLAA
jgi:large subunit ribosomal protein L15